MSTDNSQSRAFGNGAQPSTTVEDLYGEAVFKKARLEIAAILWSATVDLTAINKRSRKITRLFLNDLARRCNQHGDKKTPAYVCYPGYRDIKEALDIGSHDTISSKIKLVERFGLVTVYRRKGRGKFGSNIYELHLDRPVAEKLGAPASGAANSN